MDNLRGIALMTLAMAAFALEDMFLKFLLESVPLGQILLMLGLGGTAVFGALARRQGAPLRPALRLRAVWLRNLGEVLGTLFFVTALSLMPLSTLATILQTAPLIVTLGAALFLGAPVGWRRWSAIGVGFAGVLLIIRPGLDAFEPVSLLALAATTCLALRDLATRAMPPETSSTLLAAMGFAMVTLAGLVLLPFGDGLIWLDPAGWALFLGAFLASLVAYAAITNAMRVGEVATVTPFRYTRLLFSIAIGMAVFGERPDTATFTGAAIILAAGLYTLARTRRADG
ncbi:MAG: DMT family transporter [Pseudomonadota bacterium]